MLLLALGSGTAKLVGLAAIPLITRIYTPAEMGALSVFTAAVAILVPFASLRYVTAIPLPRKDSTALNLFGLNFILLLAISFLLAILFWVAGPWIFDRVSLPQLAEYGWLVVIGVFFSGLYELLSMWALRKKEFKVVAHGQMGQMVSGSFVKISTGLLGLGTTGLLLGQVVQQGGGVFALSRLFLRDAKQGWSRVKSRGMLRLARAYSSMPVYRLPSQFLLIFSMQAPLLFFAHIFGAEITGQLGLALMAIALPIGLLGTTTGNAYYAEISAIGRKDPRQVYEITKSVTKRMVLLALVPCLALLLLGPTLFGLAFGSQWEMAGEFSRTLSIYLLAQFVSAPLVNALTLYGRQGVFLMINMIRAALVVMIFVVSDTFSFSAMQTILIYSVAISIHYLMVCYRVFDVIKGQIKQLEWRT